MNRRKIVASSLVGLMAFGYVQAADRVFIGCGQDLEAVSPEEVLANADALDKTALDGIALRISCTNECGQRMSSMSILNDERWSRAVLERKIPLFREIGTHRSMRENTLATTWSQVGRLKPTDDVAWARATTNMAVAAWFAREAGLKGFQVDMEDYFNTQAYYRIEGDPPYDECARLMRRRAREMLSAVYREFPSAKILCYWSAVRHPEYWRAPDLVAVARRRNDLWPAFLNGMLDAMPPEARYIDGNEFSYMYQAERHDFCKNVAERRHLLRQLIAPENLEKFRTQWLMASAVYLDGYTSGKDSIWHQGEQDGSHLNRLLANVSEAAYSGDGYVWFWGERHSYIDWKDVDGSLREEYGKSDDVLRGKNWRDRCKSSTWESVLPGFNAGLWAAHDPAKYLKDRQAAFEKGGEPFVMGRSMKTTDWWPYSDDKAEEKRIQANDGRYFADGKVKGCACLKMDGVKVDEVYGVRVKAKGPKAKASVCWKNKGRWEWCGYDLSQGKTDAEGWATWQGVAYAPIGADALVLMLTVNVAEGERIDYRDVEIYRLAECWRR